MHSPTIAYDNCILLAYGLLAIVTRPSFLPLGHLAHTQDYIESFCCVHQFALANVGQARSTVWVQYTSLLYSKLGVPICTQRTVIFIARTLVT